MAILKDSINTGKKGIHMIHSKYLKPLEILANVLKI